MRELDGTTNEGTRKTGRQEIKLSRDGTGFVKKILINGHEVRNVQSIEVHTPVWDTVTVVLKITVKDIDDLIFEN